MATEQEQAGPTTLDDLDVIADGDAHTTESIDDILPYIENSWVSGQIDQAYDPLRNVFSFSNAAPVFPGQPRSYGAKEDEVDPVKMGCVRPEQKIRQMEEFGIDVPIINPGIFGGVNSVNNPRLAVGMAQGYNSWLLDVFLEDHDDLQGLILVAPQKPSKAVEEIDRRAKEDGFVGIQMPGGGLVPPAGDEKYEPIYQAAEDHGLPIVMHTLSALTNEAFPIQRKWNNTYAEDHALVHPFYHQWNLMTLVLRGVFEKYDVDFVFQESGVAWVPYWKWRLDDHYLQFSHELPYIEKLPSEYIDDHGYFTTQPLGHTAHDPTHMAKAIELVGPQNVIYASDIPHPDFDPPDELFSRIRAHFDRDTLEDIMGETACDVFNID